MTEVEDRHDTGKKYRRLFPRVAEAKEAFDPGIICFMRQLERAGVSAVCIPLYTSYAES